jgi:hypothetical protein
VYALITAVQWYDLRHNFMVDQRAWIKAQVIWKEFPSTQQVMIQIRNVGKSVALGPQSVAVLEVVDRKNEPTMVWRFKPHQSAQFSLDFPGDSEEPFPLPLYSEDKAVRKLTETEIKSLNSGDSYLVASGLVVYEDQFGKHWTRFCSWQPFAELPDFRSRSCVAWNAVGDGEPPQ